MKQSLLVLLLALASTPLWAADTRIAFMHSHESLDKNNQPWRESSLTAAHSLGKRQVLSGGVQATERFGLRDTQLSGSYTHPFGAVLSATLDATLSPTHEVLARNALGATVHYEWQPAWLLHAGLRSSDYDAVRVNQGLLQVEHYFGNFSVLAGWRPARALATTAHSGELRGSYYYGEHDSLSLIAAVGQEATSLSSGVVLADVHSLTLLGRHALDRRWSLLFSLGHTRQGDFHTRNGVGIGLQFAY